MSISEANNISGSVSEFILLGFPCRRDIQILLFVMFSLIYLLTLLGNTSIICAVWSSRKLHTPRYTLLANFSFLEICYVSSDVPTMLANIISQTKSISYAGCLLQFYFFFSMCAAEGYFLSVMSFDRFLAICRPLHYPTIMTHHLCAWLVVFCWAGGFLSILMTVVLMSWVPFCGPNTIDHFFLWPWIIAGTILCPSSQNYSNLCYCKLSYHIHHLSLHSWVLHVGFASCTSGSSWLRQEQSFFYMRLLFLGGFTVPWLSHGNVCESRLQDPSWDTEICNLILLHGNPIL